LIRFGAEAPSPQSDQEGDRLNPAFDGGGVPDEKK